MNQQYLERIRLLSGRFYELQGLRVAVAGAAIALVFATYLTAWHPTDDGGMIALMVAFVLMVPGQIWAHRYYGRTFGRQVRKPQNPLVQIAIITVYLAVATFLNRRFPEIPAGGPTLYVVVVASLILAVRDWPWRAHYLGMAAAVAIAFSVNVFGVDVIDRGMTLAVTLLVTGVSMIGVGLLDHLLLVRLMKDVQLPEAAEPATPR